MWRPSSRSGGPLAVVGALCLLGAMLPLGVWPAPRPGDSYVFDPAPFSAVWAQRVVVPALTVSANVFVLAGLYALYRRDGPAMPDWQRWTARVTLLVALVWLFGTALVTSAGPNDFVGGVYGGLLAVLSLIVIVPGLVAWGGGYLRSGQVRLGAALAGGPSLTALYVGISLSGVDFDPAGGLLLAVPTAAMAALVGYDLLVVTASPISGGHTES
ncbi:hypothetical protein [Haloarcula halophila]|uniref:hypothetical protein n=1 Tax=Haloarcula TaxID=2237 RepID=UPI0023E447C1|nr:hypothetical protein [Halomicroarcula sp. DFY41]